MALGGRINQPASTPIDDETVDSDAYVDGSIDTAHIADNQVTVAKLEDIARGSIIIGNASAASAELTKGAANTVLISDGTDVAYGNITSAMITDATIATADIANDAITNAKIADDAIDSEHYTDGSIDTAHIADNQVTAAKIFDLARGSILIGNASAATAELTKGSANYVLTSDGTDIAWAAASGGTPDNDSVTSAKIADDAVDSEHYVDASIDFAHIQNVAANSILGRNANSSGVLSEVALTNTQILIGDGTGFTAAALSGDATMANDGAVTLAAAQTNVNSLLATDIVIGEDAQTQIDFETANEIHFDADNAERVKIDSTGLVMTSGNITINAATADETASGIVASFTAGEDLVRGEVVYFKAGDSKMWKAVATASGTMPVVAMCAADVSADAAGLFLLQGFLQDNGSFPAYTVAGRLFAPEAETSSQNVPEQTAPDSDGDFVQDIGFAVTANIVYFNPSGDVIEHA